MGSRTSLLIVQPYVARYREALFARLTERLGAHGVDLTLLVGDMPDERRDSGERTPVVVASSTLERMSGGRLRMRRTGPIRRARGAIDLVIVEQAVKNLESYPLLARQHLGGPSVAMWGHGRSYSIPQGRAAAAAKQFLTRRSQWFFAYTQAGADHVVAHGFPATRISVLNNTIDTEALATDLARVTQDDVDAFQHRLGLTPGRTALFLGGVDQRKGIDFLRESAARAGRSLPGFVLLVGGAGAGLPSLQAAATAGAPIRVLGRVDGAAKALALRAADVLAIPEWIGLVAVDSLVAGRPIVSTWNPTHSPEREYLEDGVTAAFTRHDPDAYAEGLMSLLGSPDRLADMRSACVRQAPAYSLDRMTDSFVEGILAWDDVRRAGL